MSKPSDCNLQTTAVAEPFQTLQAHITYRHRFLVSHGRFVKKITVWTSSTSCKETFFLQWETKFSYGGLKNKSLLLEVPATSKTHVFTVWALFHYWLFFVCFLTMWVTHRAVAHMSVEGKKRWRGAWTDPSLHQRSLDYIGVEHLQYLSPL